MSRNLTPAICASLTVLTATLGAAPAMADAMASETAPARVINVPKDKSLSFRLDEPAAKIVVAQPDIAEVVATTDRSFYVRGIESGSTNLLVYGAGGRLIEVIDVKVGPDAAVVQQAIAEALPSEHIQVRNLGQGVLLTGQVSTPGAARRAKNIAERASPAGVTSMLRVTSAQVVLEVRILEANRSVMRDIGMGANFSNGSFNFVFGNGLIGNSPPNGLLSLTGKGGHTTFNAQLEALEEKGAVRTLARPNLVALSGEKASFLAGGEFPFPVPAGNNLITIEFRPYGVKLNFTPTIQDDGLIRLAVEPEVSALDITNTLKINSITIPALTVRRTNTTVELRSGESLAIGGLFQHGYENDLKQIPGLGELPILSALFRSTRWKRNESELLIIVTPRLQTQADLDQARTRTISGVEAGPFDFMLNGQALDKPMAKDFNGPTEPVAAAQPQLRGAIVPKAVGVGK